MNDEDDDNDSISQASEDLLKDLLGGIVFDIEWKEDEVADSSNLRRVVPGRVDPEKVRNLPHHRSHVPTITGNAVHINACDVHANTTNTPHSIFEYAYRDSGCGIEHQRPPLTVVSMAHMGRGNALVTTTPIARGSVIYTERAVVATQVPPLQVQACQYCFRSLEGIETLSEHLPLPGLWPIPSWDGSKRSMTDDSEWAEQVRIDHYGRVQCVACQSRFCSAHHRRALEDEVGGCCLVMKLACKAVESARMDDDASPPSSVQPPMVLASRLFGHCVQYYRTHNGSLEGHFLEGFCGEAEDVNALELGMYDKVNRCYTLEWLYGQMLDILSLTELEQPTLSLQLLQRVAAQAARNGFGLLTQSPFKLYYAALLRQSPSRDSQQHQANMKQVAQALGREHLERGMDRTIEEKVAPEICAVFPLTARCNHSCEPNAQVRSQEFIDAHIDVVALRDLEAGEELLISYIPVGAGVGKRSTVQRRRELQAKYLFHCDCSRCGTTV